MVKNPKFQSDSLNELFPVKNPVCVAVPASDMGAGSVGLFLVVSRRGMTEDHCIFHVYLSGPPEVDKVREFVLRNAPMFGDNTVVIDMGSRYSNSLAAKHAAEVELKNPESNILWMVDHSF